MQVNQTLLTLLIFDDNTERSAEVVAPFMMYETMASIKRSTCIVNAPALLRCYITLGAQLYSRNIAARAHCLAARHPL